MAAPRGVKQVRKVNHEELERLARLHLTSKEIAEWFNCSVELLQREPYLSIIVKGRSETKQRLKQKAIQRAFENSDTMLIFCLKNYCGWGDNKVGVAEEPDVDIKKLSDKELAEKAATLAKQITEQTNDGK